MQSEQSTGLVHIHTHTLGGFKASNQQVLFFHAKQSEQSTGQSKQSTGQSEQSTDRLVSDDQSGLVG